MGWQNGRLALRETRSRRNNRKEKKTDDDAGCRTKLLQAEN